MKKTGRKIEEYLIKFESVVKTVTDIQRSLTLELQHRVDFFSE